MNSRIESIIQDYLHRREVSYAMEELKIKIYGVDTVTLSKIFQFIEEEYAGSGYYTLKDYRHKTIHIHPDRRVGYHADLPDEDENDS